MQPFICTAGDVRATCLNDIRDNFYSHADFTPCVIFRVGEREEKINLHMSHPVYFTLLHVYTVSLTHTHPSTRVLIHTHPRSTDPTVRRNGTPRVVSDWLGSLNVPGRDGCQLLVAVSL